MKTFADLPSVTRASPPVKWTGGKRQLLPELLKRIPADITHYAEPFCGGAALFWELRNRGFAGNAVLNDINPSLIYLYKSLGTDMVSLQAAVPHGLHTEADYYRIRAEYNDKSSDALQRAARLLWLTKTCFNGLYRENSKGGMNSPWGKRPEVRIFDEQVLAECSKALPQTMLMSGDFEDAVVVTTPGSLTYFDPPYAPLNPTSSFTSYSKGGFGLAEQQRLAHMCKKIDESGGMFLLSNSDTPLTRELYKDFFVETVQATRRINSKGAGRGKISEILVSNYALDNAAAT